MKKLLLISGLLMVATSQLMAETKFKLSDVCTAYPHVYAKVGIMRSNLNQFHTLDCNSLEISIPVDLTRFYAMSGSLDGNIVHECNPPLINRSLEDGVTYEISVTPEDKTKPSTKCTIDIAKK